MSYATGIFLFFFGGTSGECLGFLSYLPGANHSGKVIELLLRLMDCCFPGSMGEVDQDWWSSFSLESTVCESDSLDASRETRD